jgi:hypothetical protein
MDACINRSAPLSRIVERSPSPCFSSERSTKGQSGRQKETPAKGRGFEINLRSVSLFPPFEGFFPHWLIMPLKECDGVPAWTSLMIGDFPSIICELGAGSVSRHHTLTDLRINQVVVQSWA